MNTTSFSSKALSIGPIGPKLLAKSGGSSSNSRQQKRRPTPTNDKDLPGQSRIARHASPPKHLCLSTMNRIKCCKNWRDAIASIQDVERQGYVPDKHMICAAISKCGQQGIWVECLKMLNSMTARYGVQGDAAVYNAALSGVAKAGKKHQALGLLREMIEEKDISPTVKTYTIAVSACGGDWKTALSLHDAMKERGIEPDCFSYSATITSCGKGGQADAALALYAEMKGRGIDPNEVVYCSLIKACFETQTYPQALGLVREATAKGIYPNFKECCGEWDLCQAQNGLSEATSCMLIADALMSTAESLSMFPFGSFGDITIMTKKGGVLRRKVPSFLTNELGLNSSSSHHQDNEMIVISFKDLQEWVCSLEYKVWKSLLLYGTSDLWRYVL